MFILRETNQKLFCHKTTGIWEYYESDSMLMVTSRVMPSLIPHSCMLCNPEKTVGYVAVKSTTVLSLFKGESMSMTFNKRCFWVLFWTLKWQIIASAFSNCVRNSHQNSVFGHTTLLLLVEKYLVKATVNLLSYCFTFLLSTTELQTFQTPDHFRCTQTLNIQRRSWH